MFCDQVIFFEVGFGIGFIFVCMNGIEDGGDIGDFLTGQFRYWGSWGNEFSFDVKSCEKACYNRRVIVSRSV